MYSSELYAFNKNSISMLYVLLYTLYCKGHYDFEDAVCIFRAVQKIITGLS